MCQKWELRYTARTLSLSLSQAYEKRQRGEQEEEEAEDEIFSHKTIVTKFLNRVITEVQTRIECFH